MNVSSKNAKINLMIYAFSSFLILLFISCRNEYEKVKRVSDVVFHETNSSIKLQVSSRVDTMDSDVKQILHLYENYINSRPDSIYDNPYWNRAEKARFRDFDLSRVNMFNGIRWSQLFKIYTPFVLSIEPKNEKYQIRVLYSNTAVAPPYVGSKVWCIQKLNATFDNGEWRLENLIVEKTKHWLKQKKGFIEYVFPQELQFNVERANQSWEFCEEIVGRFNPEYDESFRFYLANDVDEMGELENFDYIFSGITTGKAREGMILSSKGDEFYPHEFIHKLLPINENRGYVIEEGLATFLGTKEELDTYLMMMKKLAKDYNKTESYSLENILNNTTQWNGYPSSYPGGALICEVIYEMRGDAGIIKLLKGNTKNYEQVISLCEQILQLTKEEIIQIIHQKIRTFE